jgi:hypothetical protein
LPVAGEAGRNEAFRLLFAFIAGANRTSASGNDKIAMTVPVEVRDKERMAMTVPINFGAKRHDTDAVFLACEIQVRERTQARGFPGATCHNPG